MIRNNTKLSEEYKQGIEVMKNASVSICSIVRDCERNLIKNRDRIEQLRLLFQNSEVIVFENDSKDNTRQELLDWQDNSSGVHVFYADYGSVTIPTNNKDNGNKYFSISRIEKMAAFRNKYINYLNSSDFKRDFVIVIDLDISNFDLDGVVHSFGMSNYWDSISANGTSISKKFKAQYHDSYALIESGKINEAQTEQSIYFNRERFSFLKPGLPLFQVDSAYGGIAIYKWTALQKINYSYLPNSDSQVGSKSEHVALHLKMKENGFHRIFINPSMLVHYRSLTLNFILTKITEKLK